MENLKNPWVGYFDRSYEQIKKSLLSRLVTSNPEMTDHSEGNPLVIILSMFAGVAEMLGLYIDTMAREAFLPTAQRFSSMVKLTRVLDYRIKSYIPATVDLTITFLNGSAVPTNLSADYVIPLGTRFKTLNGIEFISTKAITVKAGNSSAVIPCSQKTQVLADILGITSGLANQAITLLTLYADNTMSITINGESWDLVDSLGLSGPTDRHYIVDINEAKEPYIKFGNNTNGKIPTAGYDIVGTYYTTRGAEGNTINAGTITTIITVLTMPAGITSMTVTNLIGPSGGSDIEGIESIRVNAPLSIRTLDRAVTPQDFRDLLKRAPGVLMGDIKFCCGKCIDMYVIPINGTIASQGLLETTKEYFACRKMVTTCINVKAAGVTPIIIGLTIYGRYRQDVLTIQNAVEAALTSFGSINSQTINATIAISDIIALVDNLNTSVDRVELDYMYAEPYGRPIYSNTQLNWQRSILPTALTKAKYSVVYSSSSLGFYITRDTVNIGFTPVGVLFVGPDIEFKINAGPYVNGDTWEFTVYPYNKTIVIDDFTVPVISSGTTVYNIIENLRDGKCDNNC